MMKKLLLAAVAFFLMASPGAPVEIGGVDMPDTLKAGKDTLVLNGGGVRKKYFMNMYVGGLYLKEKSHDAKKIIAADEPMAIRLHIVSKLISSGKMTTSTLEGFEASTKGNTAPIQREIDNFIGVFKEGITKNDIYDLIYIPVIGVESFKNDKLVTTVPGLEFKQALFGIWLCEKPTINLDLKEGMLEQK